MKLRKAARAISHVSSTARMLKDKTIWNIKQNIKKQLVFHNANLTLVKMQCQIALVEETVSPTRPRVSLERRPVPWRDAQATDVAAACHVSGWRARQWKNTPNRFIIFKKYIPDVDITCQSSITFSCLRYGEMEYISKPLRQITYTTLFYILQINVTSKSTGNNLIVHSISMMANTVVKYSLLSRGANLLTCWLTTDWLRGSVIG